MAKCPVCGKSISSMYLNRSVDAVIVKSYNVSLRDDDLEVVHMAERDSIDTREILGETYYCPECGSEIAKSGDEARNILKGG